MGTFAGHALPGSFFIILSLWPIYFLLKSFYRRRAYDLRLTSEHVPVYVNRVSYPLDCGNSGCCRGKQVPLDSFLKMFTCLIGITGEIITGFDASWNFVHIGNVQHTTMFSVFALSGFVELLIHYSICKIPLQMEFIFGMIALLSESFLFMFHLHARTPVDVYLHLLLLGAIILSIVGGLCEVLIPGKPVYSLLRNWGLLMQGTWFWQVGAILYPPVSWMPTWDEVAKQSFPRAANLFCYHLLATYGTILLMAILVCLCHARMDARTAANRLEVSVRRGKEAGDGRSGVQRFSLDEDDDDDVVGVGVGGDGLVVGGEETELWSRPSNVQTA